MRKYLTLYLLSWQKQLETRTDFLFERARSLSVLLSIYFLWSALLTHQTTLLGYRREDLLTYVLVMTLLRAWVLGCVTDRIPSEIARGLLSDILLRPMSHLGYWAAQDAATKTLNVTFAILEVGIFSLLVRAPFLLPHDPSAGWAFAASVMGAMVLYFQMSYLLGVMGFWTAQSWGPRFCYEIILEFCAGAYFPIDLLPVAAQKILSVLPFPYLIFYPLSIYLGRVHGGAVMACLGMQLIWIAALALLIRSLWRVGLRKYAAEGR